MNNIILKLPLFLFISFHFNIINLQLGNAHGHSNSHNSFVGGAVPYKEAPPPKLSVNLPVTQPVSIQLCFQTLLTQMFNICEYQSTIMNFYCKK